MRSFAKRTLQPIRPCKRCLNPSVPCSNATSIITPLNCVSFAFPLIFTKRGQVSRVQDKSLQHPWASDHHRYCLSYFSKLCWIVNLKLKLKDWRIGTKASLSISRSRFRMSRTIPPAGQGNLPLQPSTANKQSVTGSCNQESSHSILLESLLLVWKTGINNHLPSAGASSGFRRTSSWYFSNPPKGKHWRAEPSNCFNTLNNASRFCRFLVQILLLCENWRISSLSFLSSLS